MSFVLALSLSFAETELTFVLPRSLSLRKQPIALLEIPPAATALVIDLAATRSLNT